MTARSALGRRRASGASTATCQFPLVAAAGEWFAAVFAALLNRYGGQEDIVLAVEDVVRTCRVRLAGQSVTDLAAELVDLAGTGSTPRVAFHHTSADREYSPRGFGEYDLVLGVRVDATTTTLTCRYDDDLFAPEFVEWLIAAYRRLLVAATSRPTTPIRDLLRPERADQTEGTQQWTAFGSQSPQAAEPTGDGTLRPRRRPRVIPLSYAQQRLWLLNKLGGPGAALTNAVVFRLFGPVDTTALAAALGDVVVRHETLRTIFAEVDGQPVQRVVPVGEVVPVLTVERVVDVEFHLREAARHTFDLATEIPLRAWLFQIGADEHVLMVVVHRIAGDCCSLEPLSRDLGNAYAARCCGEVPVWSPLPVQYADYTLWQREVLSDSAVSDQLLYWAEALSGLPADLELSCAPETESSQGLGVVDFAVGAAVHRGLTALAERTGTSTFTVLHAALALVLAEATGATDIPIGTPVTRRHDQALQELVGAFANTVVLRADLRGDPTFEELLARLRRTEAAAFTHQDIPYEQLVRELNRRRLVQVMMPVNCTMPRTTAGLPGLIVQSEPYPMDVDVDLSVGLHEEFGPDGEPLGVRGAVDYRAGRFDRLWVTALADRLRQILRSAVDHAVLPVSEIQLLAGTGLDTDELAMP